MTATATTTRRPGKLPGVPTLGRKARHRLKVRAIDAEIIAGLYSCLTEYLGFDLPDELKHLEPLYRRGTDDGHRHGHRTYGEVFRHLADLSDLSDVLWNGGAGVEGDDGKEMDPADVYPCLAQLR